MPCLYSYVLLDRVSVDVLLHAVQLDSMPDKLSCQWATASSIACPSLSETTNSVRIKICLPHLHKTSEIREKSLIEKKPVCLGLSTLMFDLWKDL